MAFDAHKNFAYAQVSVAPSPATSGTTFSVTNAQAALFDSPASVGAYNATIWAANQLPLSTNAEIVRVTAKGAADSGGAGHTQLTITRTQESTSARSIQVGDQVAVSITKKVIKDIEDALTAKTVVTVGTATGSDYVTDGTADNVELQAAIDAVNAAGGGTVFLKMGTYTLAATVNLKSNVTLLGEGWNSTKIVLSSNFTLKVSGQNKIRVSGLRIDANAMTAGNVYGFYAENCVDVMFDHNYVENASGFGVFVASNASNTTKNIWITDNYVQGKGTKDVIGGGPANSTGAVVKDVFVERNIVIQDSTLGSSHKDAINFVGAYRLHFNDNIVEGSVLFGSEQFPHKFATIQNNVIRRANGAARASVGLILDPSHTVTGEATIFTGNTVEGGFLECYSNPTTPLYKSIVISNNTINCTGAVTQTLGEAGIVLVNTSYPTVADNNIYANYAAHAIASATDVNTTTDVITKTAHGLETGQPVLYTAGTAAITGLTTNTNYYVIRVDANSFKVATTQALANAGTAVDLTGTGTGTQTFAIGVVDGIWLKGVTYANVNGNTVRDLGGWAYKESNSSDNNFVTGNLFNNNVLGTLTGLGSNTVAFGNKGDSRGVPIAYGGTGATTAAAARTNLGVQRFVLTVGASDADYITDGTADEVQIQAAIDACLAAGGGTVRVKEGTYNINARMDFGAAGGGGVTLEGAGIGATIFQYQSGTSETYMFVDNSDLHDITIKGITFDATGNQDAGFVVLQGVVSDINVSYNEFKNVDCPVTEKWPLKIGTVDLIEATVSSIDTGTDTMTINADIPNGTPILFLTNLTATVDSGTDVITVGQNIATGTALKFTTTGTYPGGVNGSSTYYAINQSSTTIKVATSSANATAGTAIDLTSNGTGTIAVKGQFAGLQPGGLSHLASYYAIRVSGTQMKVATTHLNATAGTAVDITSSGTGTTSLEAADYATSQSRRVLIEHNRFTDCDPSTFEIILAVNMKDSWVLNNYFENNTLTLSDEVSFYPHHENTVYAGNIHNNSTAAGFGAKDSIGVKVHDNIFSYTSNSGEAVNMRDTLNSAVYDNLFICDRDSNTARAIGIEDTSGPAAYDGWPPFVQATRDLTIKNNKIVGYKYGIEGALSSNNRDLDLKYVYIDGNTIDNVEVPIRAGTNASNIDLKYWFVENNRIINWRGTLLGAIHFIGYTTDPSLVNEIYVRGNYVAPRASGSNGSVRAVGATITEVSNNILTTAGSYGATSVANGGVFTRIWGNVGAADNPDIYYASTSTASSATPTPTGDRKHNELYITAAAVGMTVAAPTGTPANGNRLIMRFKDNGTSRSLALNAIFRVLVPSFPSATTVGKTLYVGSIYNSTDSKWDIISVTLEP